MNRDEVLERSRKEKIDEGMVEAENTGRKVGYFAFSMMYLFLVFFNMHIKENRTTLALAALYWVIVTSETYGKYRFSKKNWHLITTIMHGIASLTCLLIYIFIF